MPRGTGNTKVFLMQSPHAWTGVWQRPHHIVSRLARMYPCYYINSQYLFNVWRAPGKFLRERRIRVHQNLEIQTILLLNGERFKAIRSYNKRHLAAAFQRIASQYQADQIVLWIYNPHESHLADTVPHRTLVYDIMDEYAGFPWSPPNIEAEERKLLEQADVVFAGTKALHDAKRQFARKIRCLLSAVEFDHFHQATRSATQIPEDMRGIREHAEVVLGYYGMVDMRIDQGLLAAVAQAHPKWAIVLIGPRVGSFDRLERQPNVYFLGQRSYQSLPAYTKAFDVCIIPFVSDKLTTHINPTKVLEYFAAGKPVVTTFIPDIQEYYRDIAYIASDKEGFLRSLELAVSEGKQEGVRVKRGVDVARQASWDTVVKQMLEDLGLEATP